MGEAMLIDLYPALCVFARLRRTLRVLPDSASRSGNC